ncbi:MAG: replicative DNA helicase, partial [Candidatus Omnitrophota bacterium]
MEATSDSSLKEKMTPHNLEAEVAVLGCILIEQDVIAQVIELLTPDCFYQDAHHKIYACMVKLFDQSKAIDLVTLNEMIYKEGLTDAVGGSSYLGSLTTSVPTAANVGYYAKIVREKYILRKLISTATQIARDSYEATEDVNALLDRAERMIFDIASKKFSGGVVSLKEVVRNQIEIIDRLYQRKEHVTGIATGYHEFDTQTAGLQPSDLIVVAARPSMGKSALVTCIAEHVGLSLKVPVAIFSLEMSKEQLIQRMLCSRARVDAHKVRTGFLAQSDWPALTSAAAKLS